MNPVSSPAVFGTSYAEAYQELYRDKDYRGECDFLEAAFERAGVKPRTILDMGCGTGGHALLLAERGYDVVGVDRSSDMLRIARSRAKAAGLPVEFHEGDIRSFQQDRRFDAVISMFAVMCYQTTNHDLESAMRTAARHLAPGGVFFFDGWYGPGVLTDRPTERAKIVQRDGRRIIRFTTPVLDVFRHTVDTQFTVLVTEGERIVSETRESHLMRFLFPQEIEYYLTSAGFDQIHLTPFMAPGTSLGESTWQFAATAKRTS